MVDLKCNYRCATQNIFLFSTQISLLLIYTGRVTQWEMLWNLLSHYTQISYKLKLFLTYEYPSAFIIIVPNWKQPKCPSVVEKHKQMMKPQSVIKMNKLLTAITTLIIKKICFKWENRVKEYRQTKRTHFI